MKEFIEKLNNKLNERLKFYENRFEELSGTERDAEDWGSIKSYKDTIEIVKELEQEYNNGWIPCSERLPERNTNVIAQFLSGVVSELLFNEKGLFQGIYEYGPNVIVAWQPLPEPYKPQESEWKDKVMKHFTNVE